MRRLMYLLVAMLFFIFVGDGPEAKSIMKNILMKLMYIIAGIVILSSCSRHSLLVLRAPSYTKYKGAVKYKDTVAFAKPLLLLYEQADRKTFLPVHDKSEQLTQSVLTPVYRTLLHQKLNLVNYNPDTFTRRLLLKEFEIYTDRITHYHKEKDFRLSDTLVTLLKKDIQQKYIIIPFIKWSTWTEAYYNKKKKKRAWANSRNSPGSGLFGAFYSEWFLCIEVKTGEIIYYRGGFDEIPGRESSPDFYFKIGNYANHHVNLISRHFLKRINKK